MRDVSMCLKQTVGGPRLCETELISRSANGFFIHLPPGVRCSEWQSKVYNPSINVHDATSINVYDATSINVYDATKSSFIFRIPLNIGVPRFF